MALHSETEIYRTVYTLLGAAGQVVMQMRRDAKKVFGEIIIGACVELDLHVRAANMAPDAAGECGARSRVHCQCRIDHGLQESSMNTSPTPSRQCIYSPTPI